MSVIPYLEKTLGRNIRASIWRAATITAEEESFFDELLPESLTELEVKQLRTMPLTLQRRTVRDWLRVHEVPEVNFAVSRTCPRLWSKQPLASRKQIFPAIVTRDVARGKFLLSSFSVAAVYDRR